MTFSFVRVNEVYIDNVINKLKNKSSCGYDNIFNKHIKYAKNVLTKPLTLLVNQCLHIAYRNLSFSIKVVTG